MARFKTSVSSPAGVQRVFDELAAFQNIVRWDPGVLEAKRLDEGPVRIGSSFWLLCAFGPQRIPLTYVIQDFQPPHRMVLEAHTEGFSSLDVITVAAGLKGSVMTYDATLTLHGLRRVMDPLLQLAFGVTARRAEAGLKKTMAALGPDSAGGSAGAAHPDPGHPARVAEG
jgi:hypothetical protein